MKTEKQQQQYDELPSRDEVLTTMLKDAEKRLNDGKAELVSKARFLSAILNKLSDHLISGGSVETINDTWKIYGEGQHIDLLLSRVRGYAEIVEDLKKALNA
jgi:hypothetical protein